MELPALRIETEPRRLCLDSGSTLLTMPVEDVYGIAIGVVVQSGTRDEPDELAGISHLLEHMVFKGTDTRSAFELARAMEALGGQLDAYTTKEYTAYTLKVLPAQLPSALAILIDMLLRPSFPADQLELEKQVVTEEILSSEDNPDDYVHERFAERLWPNHPLRRPILGTEESVRGIDRDALRSWCRKVHRGANVIVSAAGAIGSAEQQLLERVFDFPDGGRMNRVRTASEAAPGIWCRSREALAQQYVEIGVPGVDVGHPDRYALSVLASTLGGGMSSRLFQRVREEEGLAYSIYSYADFFRDSGALTTSLSASRENCQPALDAVAEEYERLRRGEIDEDEVQLNRAQLISSVILGLEGSLNQAMRLARSEMFYQRFVPVAEIVQSVESVRREDVIRLAERYLDCRKQTVVGYGPLSSMRWPGR